MSGWSLREAFPGPQRSGRRCRALEAVVLTTPQNIPDENPGRRLEPTRRLAGRRARSTVGLAAAGLLIPFLATSAAPTAAALPPPSSAPSAANPLPYLDSRQP